MADTHSAAGASPVDAKRSVPRSQAASSVAIGNLNDKLGVLDGRLNALETIATDIGERQKAILDRLDTLGSALADGVDDHREILTRQDERLKALETGSTEAVKRQKAMIDRLGAISAALVSGVDSHRDALMRLMSQGSRDMQELGREIAALEKRQEQVGSATTDVLESLARAAAAADARRVEENLRFEALAGELIDLHRVRDALQREQGRTEALQRRRLDDLARIQALGAERDALEIELQSAASRHRRMVRGWAADVRPVAAASVSHTSENSSEPARVEASSDEPPLVGVDHRQLLADARAAKACRDWPRAREAYAAYVAARPRKASAWKQYGHALKENGDLASAEAAYFRSLALAPADLDTCLHLAHVLKNRGNRELAAEVFSAALKMNPDFGPAKDGLGDLGFAVPEAVANTSPRKIDGKLTRWLFGKRLKFAQAAFSSRQWKTAERRYRSLLLTQPWNARLMIQIGHTLKEQGRLDAAVQMYRKAADQEPLNSDAQLHLGHVAKLAGDLDLARGHYLRSLRYWPQNPDALHELRDQQ